MEYITIGRYWRIFDSKEEYYFDLPKDKYSEQFIQDLIDFFNNRQIAYDKEACEAAYNHGYDDGFSDGRAQGWDECCEEYDIIE